MLDSAFKVFPNPSDGLFSLTYLADEALKGKLKIISFNGQVVLEAEKTFGIGAVINIDLQGLAAGHYILEIETEKGKITKQLILK
ncbi:MAG: T9SS type A sorting domain-containing protein [Bacteroidetes bacterium]|nr:T9SS type A sorting domain-containing protein [Bacteroidota bacterium]HET6244963.1 T9SS type A sorting domain-containing protein [Bacteroidia bacterium]